MVSSQATPDQGPSLSRYWERFRGWANARDMSLVAYQVGLIFDALMCDRHELAKDHVALLAVSLEQASLDGARMDIGFQLTWLEEPPSSLYLPRTTGLARGRSFAPLASQRWMQSSAWGDLGRGHATRKVLKHLLEERAPAHCELLLHLCSLGGSSHTC